MSIFGGLPLTDCGHVVGLTNLLFVAFIDSEEQRCPVCGRAFNAWDCVRINFVQAGSAFSLLSPFGGLTLLTRLTLKAGTIEELDLEAHGLPPDATIRGINLTGYSTSAPSQGVLVPAILFGNEPRLARLPHSMRIYLVPVGEKPPAAGDYILHVQFIRPQIHAYRELLVGAAIAHGDDDFRRAVIDAHTAVDTALMNALARRTGGRISHRSKISFADKIGVVASLRYEGGRPEMPQPLLGAMKELNVRRNDVAHPRKNPIIVDQDKSADLLTAALFMVALAESDFGLGRGDAWALVE